MIATSSQPRQPKPARPASVWQRELAQAISDPLELCRMLGLERSAIDLQSPEVLAAGSAFALRVPRGFVRRMRAGDPNDPLLRQVLARGAESAEVTGFVGDPLAERAAMRAPGLLHKYHGRALLVATGACAVHCRYCFRREFPYQDAALEGPRWQAALEVLGSDSSITELILSGGDPLSLSNARLMQLTTRLQQVPHLRRLRIHTRTPIVLPERIDDELLAWLAGLPWPCVIVLHCNHANEIDDMVREAMRQLRGTGVTLLNQSVLLAGINDSADALTDLSEALWSAGILPYYLHLLDPVRGTAHFEVCAARGRALMAQISARLPGYLVPRLVRETPGAPAKTVLTAGWDALHSPAGPEC